MSRAVQALDLHLVATPLWTEIENRQGGIVEPQPTEAPCRVAQQGGDQAAQDGVVANQQHGVVAVAMTLGLLYWMRETPKKSA